MSVTDPPPVVLRHPGGELETGIRREAEQPSRFEIGHSVRECAPGDPRVAQGLGCCSGTSIVAACADADLTAVVSASGKCIINDICGGRRGPAGDHYHRWPSGVGDRRVLVSPLARTERSAEIERPTAARVRLPRVFEFGPWCGALGLRLLARRPPNSLPRDPGRWVSALRGEQYLDLR